MIPLVPLFAIHAAMAAQVSLDLDTNDMREGQTINLSLTVEDASTRDVPKIAVPDGLQLSYAGQRQNIEIINFNRVTSTTFLYELTALTRGDYVLGPVTVQTASGPLQSTPVSLHVGGRVTGGTDTIVADIGADAAWVGQILVYHMKFQTEKSLVGAQWTPPQLQGFTGEGSVKPETPEYQIVQDGRPISVEELYYPIRASAPGKAHIPGGVIRAQFPETRTRGGRNFPFPSPFAEVRTDVFSANPLDVDVRPVPTEGRPKDATNLVGHFTLTAQASATEVKAGDTVTLSLTVVGDGALAGFTLPPLEGDGFRVYDDQPALSAKLVDGRYEATAAFKRAIVPQVPGDVTIPAVTMAYFDPSASKWATAATEPITLHVSGAAATGASVKSFGDAQEHTVDALAEDILPIRTDVSLHRPLTGRWSWALLAPGAIALVAEASRQLVRRPRAVSQRRVSFEELPPDPEGRLAGLDRILRERAAGPLGMAPDALRREDLAGLGDNAELADTIWRELESLRYGGRGEGDGLLADAEAKLRTLAGRLP